MKYPRVSHPNEVARRYHALPNNEHMLYWKLIAFLTQVSEIIIVNKEFSS